MIQDPTDGGIVLFGSPGTHVFNNTIWVVNQTLLGGINMVDYDPWSGDFTGTVVYNNTILGGFATGVSHGTSKGLNTHDAIIKIAIAIGPRTWFGDKYGNKTTKNGVARGNILSGAFSYGVAITSSENFVVQSNTLLGNTSFISARGPNCTVNDVVPASAPYVVDPHTTKNASLQSNFVNIGDGDSLTCVLPPSGGDFWPFGLNPSNSSAPFVSPSNSSSPFVSGSSPSPSPSPSSTPSVRPTHPVSTIAIVVAVVIVLLAIAAFFIRRLALSRSQRTKMFNATKGSEYTRQL